MDSISMGRMVGNMNKWKDEPYPWHNEPVNRYPDEFKDSVWASGDRKPVHDEHLEDGGGQRYGEKWI